MTFDINGIRVAICETGPYEPNRAVAERRAVTRLIADISKDLTLEHHRTGAPYLAGVDNPPFISITHGAGLAAIATTADERHFGIDIEESREQLKRVARRFLTEAELEDAEDRTERLLEYWTAKEAVYKGALTAGLPLQEISVDRNSATATSPGCDWTLYWRSLGNALMCLAIAR